jgi:hypothetical protein
MGPSMLLELDMAFRFSKCFSLCLLGWLVCWNLWSANAAAQEVKGPIVDTYRPIAKQIIEAAHQQNDSMRKLEEL